jgi:hypothetical protein
MQINTTGVIILRPRIARYRYCRSIIPPFDLGLQIVRPQQLFIYAHLVDALLCKLKRREENRIHNARARHRDAETAVHAGVHELDFGSSGFVAAASEAVALVDAFCCVDWEYLSVISKPGY